MAEQALANLVWKDCLNGAILELPIGRVEIMPFYDFATGDVIGYHIDFADGQEGSSFATFHTKILDLDELKREAIRLLKSRM